MSGNNYTIGITDESQIDNDRLQASVFTPFVCSNMSKRVNPKNVLTDAKSIIVINVPYNPEGFYTNLSSLGVGCDYHKRVKDVLRVKAAELARAYGPFRHRILVDSPTLCERSLAVRAGLGFFGKNGLVISPVFGSRFNIGVMLTDIPVENIRFLTGFGLAIPALSRSCFGDEENLVPIRQVNCCPEDCGLCLKACPNGAIRDGKPLNVSLCISYLTQKENLTAEEEKLLQGQLYGCDICQNICPKNAKQESTYFDPKKIFMLSDNEINEHFGHTAMGWKIGLLKRNALIAVKTRKAVA